MTAVGIVELNAYSPTGFRGGHVGVVVGHTAKTELWPRVATCLRRHD